jgi:hypothetical protein
MVCPNKRLKAWKDLVKVVGEDKAYLLWDDYQGNVPQEEYKAQDINESATSVAGSNVSETNLTESTVDFNSLLDESAEPMFDTTETPELSYDTPSATPNSVLFSNEDPISSEVTSDQVLGNILNHFREQFSSDLTQIIGRTSSLLKKANPKVKIVDASNFTKDDNLMKYNAELNEIHVRSDYNNYSVEDMASAFIHEAVHSVTVRAYFAANDFQEKEFKAFIDEAFDRFRSLATEKELKLYGFTSPVEFMAELFSNPNFESTLRRIEERNANSPKSDSVIKNFFNNLIANVRRLMGIGKTATVDNILKATISIAEKDQSTYTLTQSGLTEFDKVADKEEFKKPELVGFENRLNRLVGQAKDNINQVRARTAKSKRHKSKKDQREHLKNINDLIDEMEKLDEINKLQVIVQYTKTLAKTVYQIDRGLTKIYSKTKDFKDEKLLPLILNYEDYLASYDLIDEINTLLSKARREQANLSDQDKVAIDEIKSTLAGISQKHAEILEDFKDIKTEQAIRELSKPEYNTQVETDFRNKLYKEHAELKIQGESRDQYASRMLATRDKEAYEKALVEAAEKIANNPSFDISAFDRSWSDSLNINSKLIQVLVNITSKVRDRIVSQFREYESILNNLSKDLIKEKGNKKPSELYKNIYEQDKNGNYFFKGRYSVRFRDIYLEEFVPLNEDLLNITERLKQEGLTKRELIFNDEYKAANDKVKAWLKQHTIKDGTDPTGKSWYPNDSYLNKEVTGMDKQVLKEAIAIAKLGYQEFGGKASLIRRTGQIEFYKFPSITKSDFERAIELDAKGIVADKKADLTQIRPDDIGYGEAVSNKGEVLRNVKIHFRGELKPDQQSLDVLTMLRKEHLNIISYKEKTKEQASILLIADISKNKQYYQTSKKTGLPLTNVFNKNEPAVLMNGEFTNEYQKIKGIIERTVYDTFHENGVFAGVDLNKITGYVNGATASVAMSFNLASGTANLFNGFTQLFIESLGADIFNTKSLLKAEKKYTTDMPHILGDLGNPVKTSFTNQLLEMYDVFGGFDPATQEFIRNSIVKKLASRKTMNGLNEMGEHAMNSIISMAVLDGLKVMNADHKYIDKQGNVVTEDKAASLLDMLSMDANNKLVMNDKVRFTKQNLTVDYHKGGKVHVNLLIKHKIFDLFGVYDNNFKNEVSKTVLGKLVMMFKNYFLGAAAYRFTGIKNSFKDREDLTEDELNYSSSKKEYIEGTYVSLIRYFKNAVIPALKNGQLMYTTEVYNSLSDHEKANLKKATIEILLTSVIVPAIGALLAAGAGPDDDKTWFLVYQLRRLESELSQFRNPIEASKIISNPVAGVKLFQNALSFMYEVATPIDFVPTDKQNFFSYLNEDARGKNILLKKGKKLVPIWSQTDKDYKQLYSLINK